LDQTIKQVVSELHGPAPIDDVIEEVLRRWPSRAKNPASSVRSRIINRTTSDILLLLDASLVAPTGPVLRGVRFRVPVSRQEANKGRLQALPGFTFFWKQDLIASATIAFRDAQGKPIPFSIKTESQRQRGPFGEYTSTTMLFSMPAWFKKEGVRRSDWIIVTIEDWDQGIFRLEREADKNYRHRHAEIEEADRRLMDWIFDRLEHATGEHVSASATVLAAHAQLCAALAYPGHHWLDAMQEDGRMQCWDMYTIRYAESRTLMAQVAAEARGESLLPPLKAASQDMTQKVFTFHAALKRRKGLWRRIELHGEQSLADFDRILRHAFMHDTSDHLSGFWRRLRRGNTKRFREVELGTIDPLGDGEGAERQVGRLDLKVGDQLHYVYDFGDWIEHIIELKAIGEPQADAEYPRIVDRSKPRYRNCTECALEGKKTRAIWYCHTCSEPDDPVLLCDQCMLDHEDHYLEEVRY